ncbi:WD40 repeat domain-containing protein [Streptomyces sp. NPDC001137]|uniref:WD40 repeat domain-containing protein n=1 Tax=Streptomyces sp. NPDC001137 TaxID=3154378 RepID=UPI003331A8CD
MAFSPDGHTLASGSADKRVRLWGTATGKLRTTLTGHTDTVESVAFSPDGHILASGGADGTVRLWGAATGGLRITLSGHTNLVMSVMFSPDGQTFVSGGADGEIRPRDISHSDPLSAMRKISRAVHRSFTRGERSKYLGPAPGVRLEIFND